MNQAQMFEQTPAPGARLSRQDLRDLMGMCDRQVGYCGVSDPAGQRALELKAKLLAIHAHGWHETARASANHQRTMTAPPAPKPPVAEPGPGAACPPPPPAPGNSDVSCLASVEALALPSAPTPK